MPRRPLHLPAVLLLTVAALLSGCGKPPVHFALANVSGQMPPLAFRLTDARGQMRTQADYRGKVVLLFFGYTHCPDVCPTTLARLARVLKALGPDADKVAMLFVSVDPEDDTPAKLGTYTAAFDPRIVGLWGKGAPLTDLEKRYHVYVQRQNEPNGDYLINHSASIYIFDGTGEIRLLASGSDPVGEVAGDVRKLVNGA